MREPISRGAFCTSDPLLVNLQHIPQSAIKMNWSGAITQNCISRDIIGRSNSKCENSCPRAINEEHQLNNELGEVAAQNTLTESFSSATPFDRAPSNYTAHALQTYTYIKLLVARAVDCNRVLIVLHAEIRRESQCTRATGLFAQPTRRLYAALH